MLKWIALVILAMTFGIWGYFIGSLEPRVLSSDNQVTKEICDQSKSLESRDWEDACKLAENISK